jgi:hypothetical protein
MGIKISTGRNDQNSHDGDICDNLWVNPDSLINYFLSIAKKINQNIKYNIIDSDSNLMLYIFLSFKNPFSQIKFS